LVEILFVDENTGYALERMNREALFKTTNGGAWTTIYNILQESMFEVTNIGF
jgi:photosystem II stability/assembly factor-like uncharacterized protein